ncbi:hypothetical protein QVD17_05732 [Tagetes erecta]|uniref:Uncharacterized protein n=1 Tax=Tagetes erecta TaxID=13708 RepID=A0AAD8PBQ5_TARER|nr:hypothetical protein QVD17_05732 [Tagetes erecta]
MFESLTLSDSKGKDFMEERTNITKHARSVIYILSRLPIQESNEVFVLNDGRRSSGGFIYFSSSSLNMVAFKPSFHSSMVLLSALIYSET